MRLALRFRSHDSKSTFIISWENGEIIKRYNSTKPYRSPLAEPPASVAAFEAICRSRFQLGTKWRATDLIGVTV